jgi:hypothetical protein
MHDRMFDAEIEISELPERSTLEGACQIIVTAARSDAIQSAHSLRAHLNHLPFETGWLNVTVAGRRMS